MTREDRFRWLLRGIGQTLITIGIVILLFAFYEVKITNLYTAQQQQDLAKELDDSWDEPAPTPTKPPTVLPAFKEGEGIARIFFPAVQPKTKFSVVVEGVSLKVLKTGPGHYPGTALPGAIGNHVISGHRTTYGAPFGHLGEVLKGQPIVIETKTHFYTYTVTDNFIVDPSATSETFPVPNRPGVKPTQAVLTLTTCHPKYSARQRLIVRAVLASTVVKAPGVVPPALAA